MLACRLALSGSPAPPAVTGRPAVQPPPWMNVRLSPDRRAEILLAHLTLAEKIALVQGEAIGGRDTRGISAKDFDEFKKQGEENWGLSLAKVPDSLSGDGFVRGNSRLGIPA